MTRGVWLLMVETGVRVSDAVGAKNGDFDTSGYYHFTAHKTGKDGRAKVSPDFLRKYVDRKQPEKLLFPSPRKPGKPVTRQAVFAHIKRAARLCGLDETHIATHTARKSFAVATYREKGLGATMHALQHRDASTTLLYAMSDDPLVGLRDDLKEVREDVAELREVTDALVERVFGDDVLIPTEKAKKAAESAKKRQKSAAKPHKATKKEP